MSIYNDSLSTVTLKSQGKGINEITHKEENMEKEQHFVSDARHRALEELQNKTNHSKNEISVDSKSQERLLRTSKW